MKQNFHHSTISDMDIIGKHIYNYGSHIRINLNKSEYNIKVNKSEMFIVGGALRDILTGYTSEIKDLDITGNNFCEDIKLEFKSDNCYINSRHIFRDEHSMAVNNKTRTFCPVIYSVDSDIIEENGILKLKNTLIDNTASLDLDCFEYNNSRFRNYDSVYHLISDFDYTCNMVGLDVINNKLMVHNRFKNFLDNKTIELNNDNFLLEETRVKEEILKKKYTKFRTRGWKFTSSMETLELANDICVWVTRTNYPAIKGQGPQKYNIPIHIPTMSKQLVSTNQTSSQQSPVFSNNNANSSSF